MEMSMEVLNELANALANIKKMQESNDESDSKLSQIEEVSRLYLHLYINYGIEYPFFEKYIFDSEKHEGVTAADIYAYYMNTCKKARTWDIRQAIVDESIDNEIAFKVKKGLIAENKLIDWKLPEGADSRNERNNYETVFIPVYPSAEDEKKGNKPWFITLDNCLRDLMCLFYRGDKEISPFSKAHSSPAERKKIYTKYIDVIKKVLTESYALPEKIAWQFNRNYFYYFGFRKDSYDDEFYKGLDELDSFLDENKPHIKIEPCFAEYERYNSKVVTPPLYSDLNEFQFAFEKYHNDNLGYNSFEDFLLWWTYSEDRKAFLKSKLKMRYWEEQRDRQEAADERAYLAELSDYGVDLDDLFS